MRLFWCMLAGIAAGLLQICGYLHLSIPGGLLPTLIFFMLFFTFLRISPRELHLCPWHGILLVYQLVVSFGLFYLLGSIGLIGNHADDMALAQGVALCVLMPAATAAPIIAAKIGGSVMLLTPFTLLSSVSAALIIPVVFPVWNPEAEIPFVQCFLTILRRVAPMLMLPALVAWLFRLSRHSRAVRAFADHHSERGRNIVARLVAEIPFYLWMGTLIILMYQMTLSIADYSGSRLVLLYMSIGAFVTCLLQFFSGKAIGACYDRSAKGEAPSKVTRITAGQALGQKNTTLAIWLAQTYLIPISALAPAAYIIAQNLFNSVQLALHKRS